jgi:hypothetical protein
MDRDGATGPPQTACGICRLHQGDKEFQRLKRAEEHEEMLRERFERSSAWAENVEAEVKETRQRIAIAYKSRDRAIRLLRKLNDLHAQGGDGFCSCGVKRGCRSAEVIYDRWAQMLIHRVDEQEERAMRRRELHMFDEDEDDWISNVLPPESDRGQARAG